MSQFTIYLHDKGRCRIHHEMADSDIVTDLPPEYGGSGRSFSSTDLVAAALGSCTLTSMEKILWREGYDPARLIISVTKTLSLNPRMIEALNLEIYYPEKLGNELLQKLEKAAQTCPVKRSLSDQVRIETVIRAGEDRC